MTLRSRIDHLVVVADSLEQGAAWCEATLGVVPLAGGRHALMGTHNRLLPIATPAYPQAYFEIIALDPDAADPGRRRWFDMDDDALRAAVRAQPRLAHFVAQTNDLAQAAGALKRLGIDRGELLRLERATAGGVLKWQMSVRKDGQRLFYGGLPTLIEWDGPHPCDSMPAIGVALESLTVRHARPEALQGAFSAIALEGVAIESGPPGLVATLRTPLGLVTLESAGI